MTPYTGSHFLLPSPLSLWGERSRTLVTYKLIQLIGHIKPLCVFASRVVAERDQAVVTILLAPNIIDKALAELSEIFIDGASEQHRKRIRYKRLAFP